MNLKITADKNCIFLIFGTFRANPCYVEDELAISGALDNREWKKNLIEVEHIQDFIAGGHNFGEVFVVKSEFCPTSHVIQGKWAPVYEYYTKNENGEMLRIGSGKINHDIRDMETIISIDGQDRSNDIRNNTEELIKAEEDGTVIKFNSNEYAGISTRISRKDIEQALTKKLIQAYLGNGKIITDITQVKYILRDVYIIACVENGAQLYEILCIDEDGKCKAYPGISKDMFAKKEMYFPTGITTGYDKRTRVHLLDRKQALETFKSKEGIQYSVYRDKDGILRVAQILEYANNNEKYAEELDTYSVMHEDIEKIKEQSKEENYRELILLEKKQNEKTINASLDGEEEYSLSL